MSMLTKNNFRIAPMSLHNQAMTNETRSENWEQVGIRTVLAVDEMAALNRRKDLPGILFFFGHCLTMFATGYLLFSALDYWWWVVCMVLHGVVLVYWFQPFHECAHKTAYKTPWLNSFVYWFSGVISIVEPTYFYYEHMQHHRYTQHPDIDPERIPSADRTFGYLFYLTGLPYWYYQFAGLLRHAFGKFSDGEKVFIPESKRAQVAFEARLMLSIYAALIVVSLLLQSWFLMIYWFLPRLLGEPFMRAVRLTEHQGCPTVPNLFRNTRTVLAWAPIKLLGWYACYHAEHHLSPNTPFFSVETLHRKIAERLENLETGYIKTHTQIFADVRAGLLPNRG